MAKIFLKPSSIKLPPRDRIDENEEWGRELGGVWICGKWFLTLLRLKFHTLLNLQKLAGSIFYFRNIKNLKANNCHAV